MEENLAGLESARTEIAEHSTIPSDKAKADLGIA